MTLDELAKEIEAIDEASEDLFGETIGVGVEGNSYYQGVFLEKCGLWNTEEEEREFDEKGNKYTTTVKEFVLTKLEIYADSIKKIVEQVRKRENNVYEKINCRD